MRGVSHSTQHITTALVSAISSKDLGLKEAYGNQRVHFDMAEVRFRRSVPLSLGLSAQMTDAAIEKAAAIVEKGSRLCESPIERELLPWLVLYAYQGFGTCPIPIHDPKTDRTRPPGDLVLVPQFAFIRSRFDFAFIAVTERSTGIIAIECDGAVYHDPKKDFERDEYMRSFGVKTLRAPARLIHTDPETFADRVAREVSSLVGQP